MRIDEQVAFYSVFHRDPVNRAIHAVTMPIIIVSGLMLTAPLGVLLPGPLGGWIPLNLGLGIIVVTVGAFLFLDPIGAIALGAWTFPSVFVASAIASRLGLPRLLTLNAAIQAVAWFLAVHVGHERFEPSVLSADGAGKAPSPVSSNLYFHRGYFLLRNVGRPVSALESFQQFAISPFAATLDVLFAFGFRTALRAEIDGLVRVYVARLSSGEAILVSSGRSLVSSGRSLVSSGRSLARSGRSPGSELPGRDRARALLEDARGAT